MTESSTSLWITADWVPGPGCLFQPEAHPQGKLMGSVGEVWNSCRCSQGISQESCWKALFLLVLLSFPPFLLRRWALQVPWRYPACSCTNTWAVSCGQGPVNPGLSTLSSPADGEMHWPCKATLTLIAGAKASGIPSHSNRTALTGLPEVLARAAAPPDWVCATMLCTSGTLASSQGSIIPFCFPSSQPF